MFLEQFNDTINNVTDEQKKETQATAALINFQALGYVTGYTAFKLRIEYPYLGSLTVQQDENSQEDLSWIKTISKGWLRIPSKNWFKAASIIDDVFNNYHGVDEKDNKTLQKHPGIFSKVPNMALKEIDAKVNVNNEKKIGWEIIMH